MKTTKFTKVLLLTSIIVTLFITSCNKKENENNLKTQEFDSAIFEKEIELRLREFEKHLQNGDSIALGNMYMANAVIMPSTVGRDNIVSNFGGMIRDSITGSSFKSTDLWGNDQLLVEEGAGTWFHANGQIVGSGKYLVVWKKDNGNWKILRDIWFPEEE